MMPYFQQNRAILRLLYTYPAYNLLILASLYTRIAGKVNLGTKDDRQARVPWSP